MASEEDCPIEIGSDEWLSLCASELAVIELTHGKHASRSHGMCVMEAAAWIAGREHTDHPPCISKPIGAFLRAWNDGLDDSTRQQLKPYAWLSLGTAASADVERRRSWMAFDWLVHEFLPAWLEAAQLIDDSVALRTLPEIHNAETLNAATPLIERAHRSADAAGAGAGAGAWVAAGDAAGAAASPAAALAAALAASPAAAPAAAPATAQPRFNRQLLRSRVAPWRYSTA